MADEVELIDIEGDDTEVNLRDTEEEGLIEDQYLHSGWRTSRGLLPWTLDSSVSAENRAAIESMLLEEEYYLAGKELPKNVWTGDTEKVKRSPVKPSGQSVRWAEEEKDLFEKGLAQFGRRWTKISKLIGSRTVLQVKSYARQYFKNKGKLQDPQQKAPGFSWGSTNKPTPGREWAPGRSAEVHMTVLPNAVRIERLSDDEDVDITNDASDDIPLQASHMESPQQLSEEAISGQRCPCPTELPAEPNPDGISDGTTSVYCGPTPMDEADHQIASSGSPEGGFISEREDSDGAGLAEGVSGLEEEYEGEELKAPEQEVQLDKSAVTEEEKQAIAEFFEGRPSKTPERYLKIRNYILDQWEKCKPKYLNKTSVRPGLKNCGDVNCIGRIHTYLELIGAINFGCEQAVYNRPRIADRSRAKEGKDTLEAYQLAHRLQSMRTRKRRVRDMWGNWCDAKDLEGQTFEHLSAEDLAKRREEAFRRQPKTSKVSRQRGSFDPFQLIPCQTFGEEKQEPFRVMVCAEALIVMDMHAHVSMSEVIGLLGGEYSEEEKVLRICAAEPCNSLSTGMQCEMDPVSQTQASEMLSARGYSVVGWYHSHPAFDPNPSLRDIDTQAKFQGYFSRGGAPFIGMIVSPYNPRNTSPRSQTTCLVVSEEQGSSGCHKIPFKFDIQHVSSEPNWAQVMRRVEWVVHKYKLSHSSVPMDRFFRKDSHLTCLDKMLASLRTSLEQLQDGAVSHFLAQVEELFLSEFRAHKGASQDDRAASGPCLEVAKGAVRFLPLQLESGEGFEAVKSGGATDETTTKPANQDGYAVISQ